MRAARLSTPLVMVAAALVFAAIAIDVANGGPLSSLDRQLSDWFRGRDGMLANGLMPVVSMLHAPRVLTGASVVIALLLASWRGRGIAAVFVVAVAGGATLNALLKHAFERPRPDFAESVLGVTDFSFPSGHVANAAFLYGALVLFAMRDRRSAARAAAFAAAAAMVLLVAASRLVLGAHYPTDVIAAMAEAVAWLALCVTVQRAWRRH